MIRMQARQVVYDDYVCGPACIVASSNFVTRRQGAAGCRIVRWHIHKKPRARVVWKNVLIGALAQIELREGSPSKLPQHAISNAVSFRQRRELLQGRAPLRAIFFHFPTRLLEEVRTDPVRSPRVVWSLNFGEAARAKKARQNSTKTCAFAALP